MSKWLTWFSLEDWGILHMFMIAYGTATPLETRVTLMLVICRYELLLSHSLQCGEPAPSDYPIIRNYRRKCPLPTQLNPHPSRVFSEEMECSDLDKSMLPAVMSPGIGGTPAKSITGLTIASKSTLGQQISRSNSGTRALESIETPQLGWSGMRLHPQDPRSQQWMRILLLTNERPLKDPYQYEDALRLYERVCAGYQKPLEPIIQFLEHV
ncbi:hypothetical protein K469DRAFT_692388 [Zopfia rhizophila CBS 207.26]|uniref:Uncharacterized protein n=1 Tax=Zopfia rhizophila CBS 207.26 TaxID=1314779 RepID=A0A6A6DT63_9PEZI|nr:hypothetical protein K469DRAFT_692388 [Zopfia rhizophila CBS 207.26]